MKKMMMTPKCKKCGKRYPIGNLPNGVPAMIGFQLKDGSVMNICGNCICDVGGMTEEERDYFLNEVKNNGLK